MQELLDTRSFYPAIDPFSIIEICEGIRECTEMEKYWAWQAALELGYDRKMQGFYGRTISHMLSIGYIRNYEDFALEQIFKMIEVGLDSDSQYIPALFRLEDENEEEWAERQSDYLREIFNESIHSFQPVPSLSENDENEYFTHDFSEPPIKYIDVGEDGVLLIVGKYIVGCESQPIYVYQDSEMDGREYICLNDEIVYLDTMQAITHNFDNNQDV